jgi:hypothetical protein
MKNLKSLLTAITIASVMTILPQTGVASPLAKTTGLQKSEAISDLVETMAYRKWRRYGGYGYRRFGYGHRRYGYGLGYRRYGYGLGYRRYGYGHRRYGYGLGYRRFGYGLGYRNYGYGNRQYYSGNCGFRYSDYPYNCRPFFGRRYGFGLGY